MRNVLWVLLMPATLWGEELAPSKDNHHPTDIAQRHVQEIHVGRCEYTVVQGGTMDGENDPESGRLTGKPDRAGRAEVVVAVTLERAQRSLDPAQLQWGVEKVLATGIESAGIAQQTFVIGVD